MGAGTSKITRSPMGALLYLLLGRGKGSNALPGEDV